MAHLRSSCNKSLWCGDERWKLAGTAFRNRDGTKLFDRVNVSVAAFLCGMSRLSQEALARIQRIHIQARFVPGSWRNAGGTGRRPSALLATRRWPRGCVHRRARFSQNVHDSCGSEFSWVLKRLRFPRRVLRWAMGCPRRKTARENGSSSGDRFRIGDCANHDHSDYGP